MVFGPFEEDPYCFMVVEQAFSVKQEVSMELLACFNLAWLAQVIVRIMQIMEPFSFASDLAGSYLVLVY